MQSSDNKNINAQNNNSIDNGSVPETVDSAEPTKRIKLVYLEYKGMTESIDSDGNTIRIPILQADPKHEFYLSDRAARTSDYISGLVSNYDGSDSDEIVIEIKGYLNALMYEPHHPRYNEIRPFPGELLGVVCDFMEYFAIHGKYVKPDPKNVELGYFPADSHTDPVIIKSVFTTRVIGDWDKIIKGPITPKEAKRLANLVNLSDFLGMAYYLYEIMRLYVWVERGTSDINTPDELKEIYRVFDAEDQFIPPLKELLEKYPDYDNMTYEQKIQICKDYTEEKRVEIITAAQAYREKRDPNFALEYLK